MVNVLWVMNWFGPWVKAGASNEQSTDEKRAVKCLTGSIAGSKFPGIGITRSRCPNCIVFENVQSMPDEAQYEITQQLRSVDPNFECVGIDAATVAHCRRPRYWWTNW